MKLIKKISAFAVASALAVSMAVSAAATDYKDAIEAAKNAGVPALNVQELSNFLEKYSDKFTSAQYDDMIKTLNDIEAKYVEPHLAEVGAASAAELTEDQKKALGKIWSNADKDAIAKALIDLGKKYNVTVKVEGLYTAQPTVTASMDDSKTDTKTDKPVADTGAEAQSGASAALAAFILAASAAGLTVVAKKNRK